MKISTYTCSNMYNCVATETCVTNKTSFDCHIPVYILVYMNIHVKSSHIWQSMKNKCKQMLYPDSVFLLFN